METAFHARVGRNVSVKEFKELEGPKLDGRAMPRQRPLPICLACRVPLHTIGEDSGTVVPTWGHDPSKGTYCPIKTDGGGRYELLPPTERDVAAGERVRAQFFAHWMQHWGFIRAVAPYADIYVFVRFLKRMDSLGLWEQRHLEVWHVPYIFLSSCDFPPSGGRMTWLRFRFDGRYRTIQDLWIRAEPGFHFLCLEYRAPARKPEPGPNEFIAAHPVYVGTRWLDDTFASPHEVALREMKRAFSDEF